MGKLHLAITVYEDEAELSTLSKATTPKPNTNAENNKTESSFEEHQQATEEFEPINIEGQEKTGVWIHRPGKEVCQTWEHRKGRSQRVAETELLPEGNEVIDSSISEASLTQGTDENIDVKRFRRHGTIGRGLQKLGSLFQRYPKQQNSREEEEITPTPLPNIRELNEGTSVKFITDDILIAETTDQNISPRKIVIDSPGKKNTTRNNSEETVIASENNNGMLKRKGTTSSKPDQTLVREGSLKEFLLSDEATGMNAQL